MVEKMSKTQSAKDNILSPLSIAAEDKVVQIAYRDAEGDIETITVIPVEMFFGFNRESDDAQWFVRAFDLETQTTKEFAMKRIASWTTKKARVPVKR